MSNSEPSAIVLQGIPCMCGLYKGENGSFNVPRDTRSDRPAPWRRSAPWPRPPRRGVLLQEMGALDGHGLLVGPGAAELSLGAYQESGRLGVDEQLRDRLLDSQSA